MHARPIIITDPHNVSKYNHFIPNLKRYWCNSQIDVILNSRKMHRIFNFTNVQYGLPWLGTV